MKEREGKCDILEAGSKALSNVLFDVCALRSDVHPSYFLLLDVE